MNPKYGNLYIKVKVEIRFELLFIKSSRIRNDYMGAIPGWGA